MTAADPLEPAVVPRSGTVARIDHGALARNARAVLEPGALVGLPADAFGHGFAECAHTLVAAGFAVSDAEIAEPRLDAVLGLVEGLTPVLRLSGRVLGVKALRAGEGVSYGYLHRAPIDTRIALVVGGYAQGIVRSLGGRASVTIAGERHPVIGRVAMDVCVVDVGAHDVSRGEEVVYLGDPDRGETHVADWAAWTGLTAAEIVTAAGLHATREHIR